MDAVLDSGALTAWAARRPPAALLQVLEVAGATGGAVVVPAVTIVEATTGRRQDAAVNHRLRRALVEPCTVERARQAAALRFGAGRGPSAVDAVVAATAVSRHGPAAVDAVVAATAVSRHGPAAVVTSDPDDLATLLAASPTKRPVVGV